jgi:hypothetical protein
MRMEEGAQQNIQASDNSVAVGNLTLGNYFHQNIATA